MLRPRLIPVLLLKNNGLVKSKGFKNYNYIGDPINAVKIFNDFHADELFFLDIEATKEKRIISLEFVRDVGEEAHMPFAVGGGIRTIQHIKDLINAGAERVIISSHAGMAPHFIKEAAETFGTSTIVVCMDVKKDFLGKDKVWIENGSRSLNYTPETYATLIEEMGAGEIIVQSIKEDGMRSGYDDELVKKISKSVHIPVTALGGAGNLQHMEDTFRQTHVNGLAAGSMFVYHGTGKGVLINYPDTNTINFKTWE